MKVGQDSLCLKAGGQNTEGAGLHSWVGLQLVHYLSTPLNRAEPGSCPAPRPRILGQATKAGTGTKGGLI